MNISKLISSFALFALLIVNVLNAQWKQIAGPCGDVINTLLTTDTVVLAGTSAGVYLSTDSGSNWTDAGLRGHNITSLALIPIHGGDMNIFASDAGNGVSLSTDRGIHWTSVNSGLPYTAVYALAAIRDGAGGTNLFAGVWQNGVYVSTNNGTSWTPANGGMQSISIYVLAFCTNESGGTDLFAGSDRNGVFRSTDNGKNWISVDSGWSMR